MGGICSKEKEEDVVIEHNMEKGVSKSSVQLVAPVPCLAEELAKARASDAGNDASVRLRAGSRTNSGSVTSRLDEGSQKGGSVHRQERYQHKRHATMDLGESGRYNKMDRIVSLPKGYGGEVVSAGWPSWLASVAGEAIKGWVPRSVESFEKLEKIGQGTYSSVYRARDMETGKIVAMKKVRFVNMDPESVRFMAREIHILRQLDHPNVMKLECLATSRMSGNLYLIFEYMDHDLAGLAATRGIKFSESQIKCYMQQLLLGLEHCHSRGILHRDIKGANLLIDNKGNLKIGDFGLATFYQPGQKHPLTSRVVTLWYRAPELLLGATAYGAAIDMWSVGCILAELFAGKPIMPGRTEVEQMHKIFKLCGSPSEDFWKRTKLPHATSFKPQQTYKRFVAETFKNFPPKALALVDKLLTVEPESRGSATSALRSEVTFFTAEPLPCAPSALPKYPPSKEFHAKIRNEEARRKAEAMKERGPDSVRRCPRANKGLTTPEFSTQVHPISKAGSHKYNPQENGGTELRIKPGGGATHNVLSHSTSMVHPAVEASWTQRPNSSKNNSESKTYIPQMPQVAQELSGSSNRRGERQSGKESSMGYVPRKNRIHYSGPLVPPGGNLEDMLKEHEKQIQQAVRRANQDKARTNRNDIYHYERNVW